MICRVHTLVILLFLLVSCGGAPKNRDAAGEAEISRITVQGFLSDAGPLVEQPVRITGTVVHVCRYGGQRLFLVGEDSEDRVRITTGNDIAEFEVELEGSQVEVNGIARELIIDEIYLAEWEADVMQGTTEHARGECHEGGVGHPAQHEGDTEAADPAVQAQATIERIQSIREDIAASGKDHLSDYWIETVSFRELDK